MAFEHISAELRGVARGKLDGQAQPLADGGSVFDVVGRDLKTAGAQMRHPFLAATTVRRLMRERPKAVGLAVPGMPVGSPGMEMDGSRDAYDVLLVLANGSSRVYQSYPAKLSAKSSLIKS